MHSGDLTHGEAVNLDDSIWLNMAVGALAPTDAVSFRQTFQVPDTLHGYDLTGAHIWFQFHANANGPMPKLLQYSDHPQRRQRGVDLDGQHLPCVGVFDRQRTNLTPSCQCIL
jgi:hypothetical protein